MAISAAFTHTQTACYHCGTLCGSNGYVLDDKSFCCDGCRLVYELLNEKGLCDYYKLQSHPGLSKIKIIRSDKYAYLDNESIAQQLYQFTNGDYTIVTLYIPGVHCSSCMWLLEHLNKVNAAITESRLNFTTKEVTIRFQKSSVSLRKIVELLATIGYEPYISLDEANKDKAKSYNKQRIYKLGIAGFCFGNIMMMSFPEYFGIRTGIEQEYAHLFRYLNLLLSLPVFFYCASEFFITAWKGLQQKALNIDAPIALAIIITFSRSVYEIMTNMGGGYLDSMTGIIFFMLVGRVVQERTYASISFHRDYTSYFPIAVNVQTEQGVESRGLRDLKENDIVLLHHDEIIPADSIVLEGKGYIDYSFVTGESEPVRVQANEMVYAGGKQTGEELILKILKPVAGSYLTSLWNHYAFNKNKEEENDAHSATHVLSKYFTWVLLFLAACTAIYWWVADPSKIVGSVTAMLIVACPCALLLTVTFTNGNLMRILSSNGLFLRDATVIEQLAGVNHIVFDKTGTLTHKDAVDFNYKSINNTGVATMLSESCRDILYNAVKSSNHPYSKALAAWLGVRRSMQADNWKEYPGLGIEASINGNYVKVGSADFLGISRNADDETATVYVRINSKILLFNFVPVLRDTVPALLASLSKEYKLSVLSGDNEKQKNMLAKLFNGTTRLFFHQKPIDKLNYIQNLQINGAKVMMIGDGLNDAGALQQSNVGITLADDINNFTPSCDAILDASRFRLLPAVLKMAKLSRKIVAFSFAVSIIYNIVGLFFAMSGKMQPIIAAILMPCSTLSIVLITGVMTTGIAWRLGLSRKEIN